MNKFKNAFNGLILGIKDKAILTQLILGFLAIIGGIIIKLDIYEWFAFLICIALVISFEIINSCIEKICDLITLEKNETIKMIKDLSSSAVLFSSFISLIVCLLCVLRRPAMKSQDKFD